MGKSHGSTRKPNVVFVMADDIGGPRNLLHTWATEVDDPTAEPRWGATSNARRAQQPAARPP